MHAAAGVHEAAAELITGKVPVGRRILELGAGSGAMTQRLLDLGYEVTPLDFDDSTWGCSSARPLLVDLGSPEWWRLIPDAPYDAVVALELVEHLDSPKQFFRGLAAVTRAGGLCVVSTPNVTGARSILRLVAKGSFYGFGRDEYLRTGHVSPVPWWLLRSLAEEHGLSLAELRFVGRAGGSLLKSVPSRLLQWALSRARRDGGWPHSDDGVVSLALLRRG